MKKLMSLTQYIDSIILSSNTIRKSSEDVQSMNEVKIEKVLKDDLIISAIKMPLAEKGYALVLRVLPKNKFKKLYGTKF